MEPKIWCINKSGGSKHIPVSMVEKRKTEGWVVIPPDKLDQYGNPKQMYFPQYDMGNPNRERRVEKEVILGSRDVLKVEPF